MGRVDSEAQGLGMRAGAVIVAVASFQTEPGLGEDDVARAYYIGSLDGISCCLHGCIRGPLGQVCQPFAFITSQKYSHQEPFGLRARTVNRNARGPPLGVGSSPGVVPT
jgi:hypothetical protein